MVISEPVTSLIQWLPREHYEPVHIQVHPDNGKITLPQISLTASTTMPTGILELPNELLEQILEDNNLTPHDIHNLATSFPHKTLPTSTCIFAFFRRRGITCSEERIQLRIGRPWVSPLEASDSLTILSLAVPWLLPRTRCLELSFPVAYGSHHPDSSWKIGNDFTRLGKLISRFDALDEVVLEFQRMAGFAETFSREASMIWLRELVELLNAVIGTGCRSLKVEGLKSFCSLNGTSIFMHLMDLLPPALTEASSSSAPQSWLSSPSRALLAHFKGFLKGKDLPKAAPADPKADVISQLWAVLSPEASRSYLRDHSKLTHLSILDSDLFLSLPLRYWAQSLISTSPLISLAVNKTSIFDSPYVIVPGPVCSFLLPRTTEGEVPTLPKLEHLELTKIGRYSAVQMLTLLRSLPNLRSFTSQDHPYFIPPGFLNFQMNDLNGLRKLHLPGPLIHLTELRLEEGPLLGAMDFSEARQFLPALERLTLILGTFNILGKEGGPVDLSTRPTGPHGPGPRFLLTQLSLMEDRQFAVILELNDASNVDQWMLGALKHPEAYTVPLQCVSELGLVFERGGPGVGLDRVGLIAHAEGWFELFPMGMKRVYMKGDVKASGTWKGSGPSQVLEEFAMLVGRFALKRAERVELNGEDWTQKVNQRIKRLA